MNKIFLIIFITAIYCTNILSQELYSDPKSKYKIHYSNDWKQIPSFEIEKNLNATKKIVKFEKTEKYDVGFQKRLSRKWLSTPYILINTYEEGKISDTEIKNYPNIFEQKMTELSSDTKNRYKVIIKNIKLNETYYDDKHKRLISMMDFKFVGGTRTALMIMQLTSFGSINIFFYTTPDKWENQYQDFIDFADGLEIEKQYIFYSDEELKDIKTTKITKESNSEESNSEESKNVSKVKLNNSTEVIYPILNLLFFILPLIFFLFLLYRFNVFPTVLNSIYKLRIIISAVIVTIFFILQSLIGGVILIPLILNVIFYFPLVLYIKFLAEYNSRKYFVGNNKIEDYKVIKESNEDLINNWNNDKPQSYNSNLFLEANEIKHSEDSAETNKNIFANDSLKSEIAGNELTENITADQICFNCGAEVVIEETEIRNKIFICPDCNVKNIAKKNDKKKEAQEPVAAIEELNIWMMILCVLSPVIGIAVSTSYYFRGQKRKAKTAILCSICGFVVILGIKAL